MKDLVLLAFVCLQMTPAASQAIAEPQEKVTPTFLSVSLTLPQEQVSFIASTPPVEFQVKSASRISPTRPLLIIIDPSSYSAPELRRRVSALVAALAAELPDRLHQKILVGIPVFEGIIYEPPESASASPADIVSAIMRLAPEIDSGQRSDPGRALDLLPILLKRAEAESGSVDCLWVGNDRVFEGGNGAYLSLGAERRILEACRRKGSVVHSYLEGAGSMAPICAATGGLTFNTEDEARTVIRQVLDARKRTFVLEVEPRTPLTTCGRFELTIRATDATGGFLESRAPAAIWRIPDDAPAPDYQSVRDALDWIERSRKASESGDAATAVRLIQNSVQLDPGNPDAFYFSAKYAVEAGELDIAEAHLSKALLFVPRSERALVLYADVFRKSGKAAAALQTLESLTAGPAAESALFRLALARLLVSVGRDDEAGKIYASLADLGQESAQARAEYGCLLLRLGKEAAATDEIRAALAADPENVTAMLCSAEIDSLHGRTTDALNTALRATRLRPEDPDVHLQIGKIHARAEQWEMALASFEYAANIPPARADILLHLAEAELKVGRGREAVPTLRQVLAINPLDTNAIRQVAGLLAGAGVFTNAATVLEASAAGIPGEAEAFYREAAVLRERFGQYGQALLDLQASQASRPAQAPKTSRDLSSHLDYLLLMLQGGAASRGDEAAAARDMPGMLVPGGLSLLARILGLDPASLRNVGGTGRACSALLEAQQVEVLEHLRTYERLRQFMKRNRISPVSTDGTGKETYVLPLAGDAASIQQTRKFLSFFGIKYSSKKKEGRESVFLAFSHDPETQRRELLLNRLGVDIESPSIRELRFTLGDEILPSIVDAHLIQTRILGLQECDPRLLFAKFIERPPAMKLYLALEQCAAPLRGPLLQGRPILPGAQEPLSGASGSDATLLEAAPLRGSGEYDAARLVYAYYTLAYASPSARRYFTASPGRLEELRNLIALADSGRSATAGWNPEAARLVRLLTADEEGLVLPIDHRFGPYLFPNRSDAGTSLHVSVSELAGLLQSGPKSSSGARSGVGVSTIEFLKFIQDERPETLTDDVIRAMMRSPAECPTYIDLIWDLRPPAELLAPYIDYCRELSQAGEKGWNVNRTRTSQSIFFLISAFCRNRIVDTQTSHRLLNAALSSFASADEQSFLNNVSVFINGSLLPELAKSLQAPADSPALLAEALAGPAGRQTFLFNGSPIVYDSHAGQLERIKSVIALQHLAAITDLLQTIQLATKSQGSRQGDADWLRSLAAAIRKLPTATPPSASESSAPPSANKAPAPPNPYEVLARELEAPSDRLAVRDHPAWLRRVLTQVAAALHTELGVALLGHCYAYYGSGQTAALSYDPDFVRKHDFYPDKKTSPPGWSGAELLVETDTERARSLAGSLSGLQIQLNRLEAAASAQSLGKWGQDGLLPALLSGMRVVDPQLRTDRAQEYVALSVRLGRELAAAGLPAADRGAPMPDPWRAEHLAALLSPLRADQFADLAGRKDPVAALELLSPSELFFLGQAYLGDVGVLPARVRDRLCAYGCDLNLEAKAPEIVSPALERLAEIIPAEGSTDLDAFQREVEQYGCSTWRRLGLSEVSLRLCDPYERLQTPVSADLLFDRIIDLKIRLAETGYASGAPASVAGMVGDLALEYLVAHPASAGIGSWNDLMGEIMQLSPGHHFMWMDELLNRGSLSVYSEGK